jgi:hypothetical protein
VAACPACGQSAEPAPPPGPAIQSESNPPPAGDAEDLDPGQIPPRLAWHVRLRGVMAYPAPATVKAVFLVATVASAAAGVIVLLGGIAKGSAVGPGCMLVIEAPLIGLFCVFGFIIGAAVWQLLSNTVLYAVDPERREAVRALHQIANKQRDDESPDREETPPDDRIAAPADEPEDRIAK